jgi:serine/threonine protein kinase
VNKEQLPQGHKKILIQNSTIRTIKGSRFCKFEYAVEGFGTILRGSVFQDIYFVGDIVGQGGCGKVRAIFPVETKPQHENFGILALKTIPYNSANLAMIGEQAQSSIMNEINLMRGFDNPHVLGLFQDLITPNYVHLVTTFMGGGDLVHRITRHNPKQKFLSNADAKFFFKQILDGIYYLHSKGVTHRDIKSENILLSDHGPSPLLKIADFGLSKMQRLMITHCGTLIYSAPEIIMNNQYTRAVDIWSLGCLLYAMLSGKLLSFTTFKKALSNFLNYLIYLGTIPFSEGPDLNYRIANGIYEFRGFNHVSFKS